MQFTHWITTATNKLGESAPIVTPSIWNKPPTDLAETANWVTTMITNSKDSFMKAAPHVVWNIMFILIFIYFTKKILVFFLQSYKKFAIKNNLDPLLRSFISSLIKTSYFIFIFFTIMRMIGVQAVSVATILGTAGLAIGLALQGSLANLAGGVLILFFRPFNQGDFISNNSGIEGFVFKIRILYTELITPDNRAIIVPNGQLANNAVINFSRYPERRVDLIFSVSYDTPTEKVLKILTDISNEHPKILQEKEKRIRLMRHSASSIDFAFRVWCKREDYWDVFFDCNEIVKTTFDKNGIEIPYQKIDIYNKNKFNV